MRPVTHVIFDLDGVLLDTEGFYSVATQELVGRYGKVYDPALKTGMIGRPAVDVSRDLVRLLDLPMTPEDFVRERALRLAGLFPDSRPMPGARELTAALAARRVPQAVATSSTAAIFALKAQHHAAWLATFATIVMGDDPRVGRGKPAPDIFLVTAAAMGADPACCVVIEDAPAGVAAARAAGMQVVAVPAPATGRAAVADADLVVDSLVQLGPHDLGL